MVCFVKLFGALLIWKALMFWTRASFEMKTASIRKCVRLIVVYLWQASSEDLNAGKETTPETNSENAPVNSKVTSAISLKKQRKPPDKGSQRHYLHRLIRLIVGLFAIGLASNLRVPQSSSDGTFSVAHPNLNFKTPLPRKQHLNC
jgi:hypothetical protein